jgi:seryl-tRNA synthetase
MHSWCFRHEPSPDPARMQCFRVREFVRMGSNEQVLEFRQAWLDRAQGFVTELALPYTIDIAHDPFFGRAGRLMADSQREQRLKYELLIPVSNDDKPTACMSFNYHLDHFGEPWGIHQADGRVAISGCVGFGLERIALALFRHHGLDPAHWPEKTRSALRLDA